MLFLRDFRGREPASQCQEERLPEQTIGGAEGVSALGDRGRRSALRWALMTRTRRDNGGKHSITRRCLQAQAVLRVRTSRGSLLDVCAPTPSPTLSPKNPTGTPRRLSRPLEGAVLPGSPRLPVSTSAAAATPCPALGEAEAAGAQEPARSGSHRDAMQPGSGRNRHVGPSQPQRGSLMGGGEPPARLAPQGPGSI